MGVCIMDQTYIQDVAKRIFCLPFLILSLSLTLKGYPIPADENKTTVDGHLSFDRPRT